MLSHNTALPLVLAVVQMVSRVPSASLDEAAAIACNVSRVLQLLQQAALGGAQLVVLPENCLTFGSKSAFSIRQQQAWLTVFSEQAKALNIWLVAGSLPLSDFDYSAGDLPNNLCWRNSILPFATSVVFNNVGEIVGVYRKVHLFNASVNDAAGTYRESDFFQAGAQPHVVPTPWGKMGMAICYDLRFAEYFRRLSDKGADFIVLPSAFTYTTGSAHWEILLRARAIENQCFMVGVNQGGIHDEKRKTWGDSMVVNPWGDILARVGQEGDSASDKNLGEKIIISTLDFNEVKKVRDAMPIAEHRKL